MRLANLIGSGTTSPWRRRAIRTPIGLLFAAGYLLLPVLALHTDAMSIGSPAPAVTKIPIYPTDDIQTVVGSYPDNTWFLITAGVYRMQQVTPKDGNTFEGESGAVLNGSRLLTTFSKVNNYWVVTGQTQQGATGGTCLAGYDQCIYPEDLFFDDVLKQHVGSLAQVGPGAWYFDYAAGTVYIGDDPAGHKVEIGVTPSAFASSASNVTIKNLIIEKYANPAQTGAVFARGPAGMGTAWTISDNEVRLNHGAGIAGLGNGTQVLRNNVHHNGQLGIGGNGNDVLVDGNRIYENRVVLIGYDPGWEGGGTKFASTQRLTVRNNDVHNNHGNGLWTDNDNIYTLYENNTCVNNDRQGIAHEISYDAVIRNNYAKGNGSAPTVWLWGSQILIQNSQNVEVYGNTVVVVPSYGNGIGIIQQSRGTGAYGPYNSVNNYIHNNDVTYEKSAQGSSGAVADSGADILMNGNNRFDANRYHVTDLNTCHWQWPSWQNWTGLRSQGQEATGTLDTHVVQ